MEDRLFLCALARIPFLSAKEKAFFLDLFSDAGDVLRLTLPDIQALISRRFRKQPSWSPAQVLESAAADVRYCERAGVRLISISDYDYPGNLREIYDPPFLLFVRGTLPPADAAAAAVIGTRKPTGAALRAAYNLCLELGFSGVPVVSGLARGIDTAAHRGCTDAECPSIAVLGTGIDILYPKENRDLAVKIMSKGAVISEYPPGTPPLAYNFPKRNRLISGLASVVVIAQAPERSGALITADYALDQGRDVMVLEDGLTGLEGLGTLRLAEDGAAVIKRPADLLNLMNVAGSAHMNVHGNAVSGGDPGLVLAKNLEDELCGSAYMQYGEYFRRT